MIRAVQGLAAARPPLLPAYTKPGPSIAAALAASGKVRSVDLSTCSRVVGQTKAVTAECWYAKAEWTPRMLAREQARRF
jgi:hypothetical protein